MMDRRYYVGPDGMPVIQEIPALRNGVAFTSRELAERWREAFTAGQQYPTASVGSVEQDGEMWFVPVEERTA